MDLNKNFDNDQQNDVFNFYFENVDEKININELSLFM